MTVAPFNNAGKELARAIRNIFSDATDLLIAGVDQEDLTEDDRYEAAVEALRVVKKGVDSLDQITRRG